MCHVSGLRVIQTQRIFLILANIVFVTRRTASLRESGLFYI